MSRDVVPYRFDNSRNSNYDEDEDSQVYNDYNFSACQNNSSDCDYDKDEDSQVYNDYNFSACQNNSSDCDYVKDEDCQVCNDYNFSACQNNSSDCDYDKDEDCQVYNDYNFRACQNNFKKQGNLFHRKRAIEMSRAVVPYRFDNSRDEDEDSQVNNAYNFSANKNNSSQVIYRKKPYCLGVGVNRAYNPNTKISSTQVNIEFNPLQILEAVFMPLTWIIKEIKK